MNDDSSSRIVEQLRSVIDSSASGSQLPTTRSLVAQFGVSAGTVQRAIQRLVVEGRIETRPGLGNFVATKRSAPQGDLSWQTVALGASRTRINPVGTSMLTASNEAIAMHSGYPAEDLLPVRLVRTALVRAARSDSAIMRTPSGGLPELQTWFARELAEVTPHNFTVPTAADVIVVPGSQSGLCSIFRALAAPGQAIVMESPTYWGAIVAAEQAGLIIVPIPRGATAPGPEDLDRAMSESGARLFYAQPNFANPTGTVWSAEETQELLEVIRHHNAFLVEDDWAHDFAIDQPAIPVVSRDDDGHVIYLRSLTKSISPSLRIAGVIARGPARSRIHADRTIDSLYVSGLLQAAVLDVVSQPGWLTHRRSLAQQLRIRRDSLVEHLRLHAPNAEVTTLPTGGLNLWIRLPDGSNPEELAGRCASRGLLIAPGNEWFPTEATAPFIRLNYAGPHPQRFSDAARILGEEIA